MTILTVKNPTSTNPTVYLNNKETTFSYKRPTGDNIDLIVSYKGELLVGIYNNIDDDISAQLELPLDDLRALYRLLHRPEVQKFFEGENA